jgi:hypothetical protein
MKSKYLRRKTGIFIQFSFKKLRTFVDSTKAVSTTKKLAIAGFFDFAAAS